MTHHFLHSILGAIGGQLGANPPAWLHLVLHLILIWMPIALAGILFWNLAKFLKKRRVASRLHSQHTGTISGGGSIKRIFAFIHKHSRKDQFVLVAIGLMSMPILYATLELPKVIINRALSESHEDSYMFGFEISQMEHLFVLCAGYLLAISVNGATKYSLNVYQGKVGERLLRRLRLTIYRAWRRGAGGANRAEVIPMIAQEVEPIGGFASNAFSLPVFQGGTFVTILVFMFAQDPILGAAAMTLLPVQLILIPRLQRRINALVRERVVTVRSLGGELGAQSGSGGGNKSGVVRVTGLISELEKGRRKFHREKFFMKALNNFLTGLTPFFFYSIGGYLVIQGSLTIGALVAVLAAYKDFSAPVKELFKYYQSLEDVRIRYEAVEEFLAVKRPLTT